MRKSSILFLLSSAVCFTAHGAAALSVGHVRQAVKALEEKAAAAARAGSSRIPHPNQQTSRGARSTTAPSTPTPPVTSLGTETTQGTTETQGAIDAAGSGKGGSPRGAALFRRAAKAMGLRRPGGSTQGVLSAGNTNQMGEASETTLQAGSPGAQGVHYKQFKFKEPNFQSQNTALRSIGGPVSSEAIMKNLSGMGPRNDSSISTLVVPGNISSGGSLSPPQENTTQPTEAAASSSATGDSSSSAQFQQPQNSQGNSRRGPFLKPRILTEQELRDLESRGISARAINDARKRREEERKAREEQERQRQQKERELYESALKPQ